MVAPPLGKAGLGGGVLCRGGVLLLGCCGAGGLLLRCWPLFWEGCDLEFVTNLDVAVRRSCSSLLTPSLERV